MLSTLFEIVLANAVVATLLALLVFGLAKVCRRPAIIHTLWLLVLLKLITPPLVSIPLPLLPAVDEAEPIETVETVILQQAPRPAPVFDTNLEPKVPSAPRIVETAAAQPLEQPRSILPLLIVIWLTGGAAWSFLAVYRGWRFHALVRRSTPAAAALQQYAERLAARFGVANTPQLRLVDARISPLLWPLNRRPLILLPRTLLKELSTAELDAVLAHELAHLSRRDHWVRRFTLFVTALYWWHPIVWLARRGLEQTAEQCCDAAVVECFPAQRCDYASALLSTIDFLSGARPALPTSATTFGHAETLKRRMEMILDKGVSPRMSWKLRSVIALAGVSLLAMTPWVVAEEKPEEATHSASKGETTVLSNPPAMVENTAKIAAKQTYRVSCHVVYPNPIVISGPESGITGQSFAIHSQILVSPGQEGTIDYHGNNTDNKNTDVKFPNGPAASHGREMKISLGCSTKVRIEERQGDAITLYATLESKPSVSIENVAEEAAQEDKKSSFVYSQQLKVVEQMRVGESVKVPFDGGTRIDESTWRYVEFKIERLKPAQSNADGKIPVILPAPIPDPPTAEEVEAALEEKLKTKPEPSPVKTSSELKNKRAMVEIAQKLMAENRTPTREIKNKRFVVELQKDHIGPAKFYPLIGPARVHEQKYKCTMYFDEVITGNWPVPFTHSEPRKEVVHIDRDHLIRVADEEQ